jgi:hypothetical protein
MWRRGILLAAVLVGGCSGESDEGDARPEPKREAGQPAPPADAGTRVGHGANAPRVPVPRNDPSPPTATIVLATLGGRTLGEASEPPGSQPSAVEELHEPRLQGTTIGRDPDGGVARVRVSLREVITCRAHGGTTKRPRIRYFPPPQIERIRSNVGARLPSEKRRTLALTLGRGRCGAGEAVEVEAQLWGEAINGTGLEAVTPHLRLFWVR